MQLVADIGGTNARIAALGPDGAIQQLKSVKTADFDSFTAVLSAYLAAHPGAAPTVLVVAVAGPVAGGVGRMTNLPWVIDAAALSTDFGCKAHVINDLSALGYAALSLGPDQVITVDPAAPYDQTDRQALVVGIGTGFNVSCAIEADGRLFCPPAEAGHASLPSRVMAALEALKPGLSTAFDTIESLFSGQGRRRFLSEMTGAPVARATPAIAALGQPQNAALDHALDAYAELIGHLLLDFKPTYLPGQGIFLAGGVGRSSLIAHRAGLCQAVLQSLDQFLPQPLPVMIINDDAAALSGCARYAQQATKG